MNFQVGFYTGFCGEPGTCRATQVHAFRDGRGLCGYVPNPRWQFQWCAHGIKYDYLECPRCRERAKVILKAAEVRVK